MRVGARVTFLRAKSGKFTVVAADEYMMCGEVTIEDKHGTRRVCAGDALVILEEKPAPAIPVPDVSTDLWAARSRELNAHRAVDVGAV
jgi:hypothetical protein